LAAASPTPGLVFTAWLIASVIENGSPDEAGVKPTTENARMKDIFEIRPMT
jgi:hypothetical protein